MESTNSRLSSAGDSQVRRPLLGPAWSPDAVDRRLVELLLDDGRMPNAELARRVGVPESTCSGRLRVLRERGVIAGVHADVDLGSLELPLEAMIALRFTGHTRDDIDGFRAAVADVPGVLAVFHVTGENEFLVHVCTQSPDALRNIVLDHLAVLPGVVHAETSLIYERIRGSRPLG
ncbi:Lrp/AsnC family transcriptional regulator [Dermacoccus sp. PAMC28757]|uniref:Lrp/AsnC family transcriptional regulator n=1 Tax=Dermacoccus sp. PAMC28757 TaxID=2762331 RepID=UPI002105C588|nr:Lrp/AsnC family transcriptional regulator [Dermacoccus sp. PAMC28757]